MSMLSRTLLASALLAAPALAQADTPPAKPTMQQVLDASKPGDWRNLDPQHTLYLDLPAGRVVIELAPTFAPRHVANIEALVKEKYFDGLAILRSQDNFVAQWGDPNAGEKDKEKPIKNAQRTLKAEFTVPWNDKLAWTGLPDGDVYAPEVGFVDGMPAARDPKAEEVWLTHCYGALGVGRDNGADSGGGTELYVVTGHSPRHLDRNITVVGRVVQGMEWLSSLPRGTGALGFYEKDEQRTPIKSIRLAADVPAAERTPLQLLRTDTPTFAALVEARRNRSDEWYKVPAGKIELCNVPLPVRAPPAVAPAKP
jgi:peptidylprolyl isomerase